MKIYGMEKLSLVDYDGYVSATIFTGKCNFRCGFCHNAALVIDYDTLEVMEEGEVLEYLKKRKGLLDGLCITGGEPTLYKDLPLFCEKVKAIGYSVKVDTNGTNPDMIKALARAGLADYFAMDIKNDRDNYSKIIGIDNYNTVNVEKSVEYFLSGTTRYEFRTTLIGEYHKTENIIKIGEWIKGADKYFLQKYKSGDNCISDTLTPVPAETASEYAEILKKYVPATHLRGYDI